MPGSAPVPLGCGSFALSPWKTGDFIPTTAFLSPYSKGNAQFEAVTGNFTRLRSVRYQGGHDSLAMTAPEKGLCFMEASRRNLQRAGTRVIFMWMVHTSRKPQFSMELKYGGRMPLTQDSGVGRGVLSAAQPSPISSQSASGECSLALTGPGEPLLFANQGHVPTRGHARF